MNKNRSRIGLTGCLLVVGMLAMSATPSVVAKHYDDDHGDLSRMFPYLASPRVEFKGNGTGWYDPANPNDLCIVSILGIQVPVALGFYYDFDRQIYNLEKHVFEDQTGVEEPTMICGDPFAPLADYNINHEGVNMYVGFFLPQDAILCRHKPFSTCLPIDWDWDLYACDVEDAGFGPMANKSKSTFTLFGVPAVIGSGEIWCGGADVSATEPSGFEPNKVLACQVPSHAHDVSEKIEADDVGEGFVSSGFNAVSIGHISHPGQVRQIARPDGCPNEGVVPDPAGRNTDDFVVSCLSVSVLQTDPGVPTYESTRTSHDWVLVHDRSGPEQWSDSKTRNYPDNNQPVSNPADPIDPTNKEREWWYDLSGQNSCPFQDTDCPQENKKPLKKEDEPRMKPGKDDISKDMGVWTCDGDYDPADPKVPEP